MIYKVTFGFRGAGQGWSESHAVKASSEDPQALAPAAVGIAQKRATFLGREFEINAIRIARYSNDDASARAKGVFLIKQIFRNPIQTVAQAAEPSNVALLARGSTNNILAAPTFAANTNQTFCGAPADDAVNNAGEVNPGKAGLGAAFAQWSTALVTNNYGWLASATIADREISVIDQLGNGTVEFTVLGSLIPPLVLNGIYYARVRRVNNGVSPLNGPVIVRCTAVGTLVTQEVIGLGLAQSGGSIRIYKQIQPFIGYAALTLDGEVAKHKRGRPFGSEPGRAGRRIRG